MALRREDLRRREADLVRFPTEVARGRARRSRMLARRRRSGLGLAVLVSVSGALLAAGSRPTSHPGAAKSAPRVARTVVVRPGDTLWDLAARYAPWSSDPRDYVDVVVDLNDLEGPLQSGMRIELPNGRFVAEKA